MARQALTASVEGIDEHGVVQVTDAFVSPPDRLYRPVLACGDCDHEWVTKREIGPWGE